MSKRPLMLGGVPEHFNLPWHLALESAELADIDARWEDQPGGTGEMVAKLGAAELDMVSILTEGTAAAIDKGLAVTMLQVYVSSPLQWGVFVPPASDYVSVADIDQPRVAISRFNSGSHLMAFIHATEHGWTTADDRFVVVGGLDGAIESFAGGRSDLFMWERHMTAPLVESGSFRQLGVLETPWPSFVIAVRNEVLHARTTEVGRVADAVVKMATGLHQRPGITELIATRYGLRPTTAESWLQTTTFAERSAMDPAIATKVLQTLAAAGFN